MRAWVLAPLALAACATAPARPSPDPLERLTALLVGDYASAPCDGARPGRAIHQRIRRVDPPAGAVAALYSEMRHDGPNGPFYRQSLWVFRPPDLDGSIVATALRFPDGTDTAALLTDRSLVASGALPTLPGIGPAEGPGCRIAWRMDGDGFVGRVDPATCLIVGRRGDARRIEGVTRIGPDAIEQMERGYSADMTLLFGPADGARNVWPRVK